jgi:hypothetical protein
MGAIYEEEQYFRKYSFLQLRAMPTEGLCCDPSAANAPGIWRNKFIDPKGQIWQVHHSI